VCVCRGDRISKVSVGSKGIHSKRIWTGSRERCDGDNKNTSSSYISRFPSKALVVGDKHSDYDSL
jgi:hypothetical protein